LAALSGTFRSRQRLPGNRLGEACPGAQAQGNARVAQHGGRPAAPTNVIKETVMLYWALVFFIVAIIAGFFGFGGIASASAGIAQILFFIFLVLLVVSLIMHLVRGRRGSM
jgi:uncharacterized membrane protein YtjA (UPF0391 family)